MILLNSRKSIAQWADGNDHEIIFYEPPEVFDEAILGVACRGASWFVVYDMEKVLENLTMEDGSREDAEDYFSYNIVSVGFGDETAAFLLTAIDSEAT